MGKLAPLRDELLRGDMRPLYLGWLAGVSAGEVSDGTTEPEPPLGLSRLTAAQQSLVDFLEIDEDLLSAAGLVDPPDSKRDNNSDAELNSWVSALPAAEKNAILKLLLTGNAHHAERKLKLQFLAWRCDQPSGAKSATPRRKVADLHKLAASAAKARKKQAAIQRKKAQAEQQAKREKLTCVHWQLISTSAGGQPISVPNVALLPLMTGSSAYSSICRMPTSCALPRPTSSAGWVSLLLGMENVVPWFGASLRRGSGSSLHNERSKEEKGSEVCRETPG